MPRWFRSLRFRLQAWHALILLFVVLGFGWVLYREIVGSRWDEIDAQLLSAGRVLEGALRAVPRPILESMAQDIGVPRRPLPPPPRRGNPPPPGERDRPGRIPDGPAPKRPPAFFPPGGGQLQWDRASDRQQAVVLDEWERSLELPLSLPGELGRGDGPAYFIIWRRDNSILRQRHVPYNNPLRPRGIRPGTQHRIFDNGHAAPLREVFLRGPEDTLICVGRNVQGEVRRMRELAWQLGLAGLVILGGGLCGGWWLSQRAIIPIERMTQTASDISATNLSQRMDLSGVDLELEQLGSVLNTMLERLETAFRAQQRFTADASHELRTPLAVMLSTIELSLSKSREPEEYRQQLLKCQRAAVRMHNLVQSLLSLARNENKLHAQELLEVDLQHITQECIDALQLLAQDRQVELALVGESAPLRGDAMELGQVVTNLVSNAILYNRPNGRVTVSLKRCRTEAHLVQPKITSEDALTQEPSCGRAELTITDTGIGIPASDLPHIFERFYRVDASRSRSQGGSGLGLAICQRIVTAHGGTIEVTSEPGVGSQFVVKF